MNNVIEITQQLVRIPSLPGNEKQVSVLIAEIMKNLGFDDIQIDENGSVIGVTGPKDAAIEILFDGHMDVVPVVGNWTFDPFGGEIHNGRLYGRGSTDMKGGIAAAICGIAQAASNKTLKKRVAISASVLEEVIEGFALSNILDIYQPNSVVICEPSKLKIKVAQKGRAEICLTLHGKPAHAANPEVGINPLFLAAKALLALQQIKLPMNETLGAAILVPTDIISNPYPSISMLPNAVTIRFDRRLLIGETQEIVIQQMTDCLSIAGIDTFSIQLSQDEIDTYTGNNSKPERWLPAWETDTHSAIFQATQSALMSIGLDTTIGAWPFCTNGSESAGKRKIPTIGLGPGNEEDAHTIDESINIDQLITATQVYAKIVEQMCT